MADDIQSGAKPAKRKVSPKEQEMVGDLINQFKYLFGLRGNWSSHWTEIAQRILPRDSWLFQNYAQLSQQGDKRNFEVYDSTGILALQRFAAILDSLLTPRDNYWHHITPSDRNLLKDKATRIWFEKANTVLFERRYAPRANYSAQNQGVYMSLGAYGTGVMFIDAIQGFKGNRYKNVHLGECYLQENHQGIIDSICRHFMLTARQALQKFGDSCPELIANQAEKFPEKQFFFLHWVMPRKDRDMDRKDFKGMEFASYYISVEGSQLCWEGGYRSFPYSVSRYFQAPNEAYGRSIAMDVLPALKTLNEQKKTMLKQGHRAVDPVLLVYDDSLIDGFNLTPGSMNAGGVTQDGRPLVQPLPVGNVQTNKELMDDERQLINDSFLISLFQLLTESPQMTATEVMEKVREKGILLAPTIGRQQSEYLGPKIERELDLAAVQGDLPPQTPLMREAKGEYKIIYDSPITRAQKAEGASGAQRTFELLVGISQNTQDPSYMDYINADVAIPQIASIFGTPDSWMRTPDEVNKIRQERAKQAKIQQAIDAAPAVAGLAKAMPQGAMGMPGGIAARPAPRTR